MASRDLVELRLNELLKEYDPERRVALSRQLRADMWDLLSDDDRERLARSGIDTAKLRCAIRGVN